MEVGQIALPPPDPPEHSPEHPHEPLPDPLSNRAAAINFRQARTPNHRPTPPLPLPRPVLQNLGTTAVLPMTAAPLIEQKDPNKTLSKQISQEYRDLSIRKQKRCLVKSIRHDSRYSQCYFSLPSEKM